MSRQPQVMVLQHVGCETLGTIEIAVGHAGLSPQVPSPIRRRPGSHAAGRRQRPHRHGRSDGRVRTGSVSALARRMPADRGGIQQGLPVLGVCLGSQLLAHVLGAQVCPGAGKEIGWYPVELSAVAQSDSLWQGVDSRFTAYRWHGDVFDLPAGCNVWPAQS